MNVGKSVVIKGELHGSENLTIEGQVEGKIKAQVFAARACCATTSAGTRWPRGLRP